jgi:hypothetical protein
MSERDKIIKMNTSVGGINLDAFSDSDSCMIRKISDRNSDQSYLTDVIR